MTPTASDGSTDKLQLVLLSGLLCDADVWAETAAALRDIADVTIIHFFGFDSLESMAEHVIAVAPPRFVLVGHSMGGRVALEVFRRAPQRVRALGLFNTGIHTVGQGEPESRQVLVRLAREAGMGALAARWLPPMMDCNAATPAALMERLTTMVERSTPDSFAKQIAALLNRPDPLPVLAHIHVPTLLMSATGDQWSPPAQHEDIRKHVPHAELVVIPHAGHMAPVEQPAAVATAMRSWLLNLGNEVLSETQRLAIESQCTKLIHRYARLNDAGDMGALAGLFAEQAVYARPSEPQVHIRGRDAIRRSLQTRAPRLTRHAVTAVEVTVDSSTRARAHSVMLLFVAEGTTAPAPLKATMVGTFDDVLQKVDDEWLFVQRLGSLDMKS